MVNAKGFHWSLVYHAIVHSIRSNTGYGFHNSDQGHPAYLHGARTGTGGDGDSPEENGLFLILKRICEDQEPPDGLPKIDNWKAFCELALEGYENRTEHQ